MRAAPPRRVMTHLTPGRRIAPVVDSGDHDTGIAAAGIDQAQAADLALIAPGKEERHVVEAPGPPLRLRRRLVDAGHETARGPNVREGLDVQTRGKLQPPVAGTVADACGQPRPTLLQLHGGEMPRLLRAKRQRDGAEAPADVVDGANAHRAGTSGAVDDPHQPLLGPVGSRGHQREGV